MASLFNAHPLVTLGPVAFTEAGAGSRVAALVCNLLGDEKGRYYSESLSALTDKVLDVVHYPDTVVYLFDTTNDGEMRGAAHTQVTYNQVSGRYAWRALN